MSNWNFLRSHRSWEDWLSIALGVVIMLAPWIVEETSNQAAVVNAALCGIAVLLLAELDLVSFRRWAEAGQLGCGLWVAASPFVLGYSGGSELQIWHTVSGLAVALLAALELWQKPGEDQ
ncbi:MAG: SPW repeat protein [Alphaproteobacteria bacterium]|nr:SPW repeat protein [Alphaproteobacteria bacterium]